MLQATPTGLSKAIFSETFLRHSKEPYEIEIKDRNFIRTVLLADAFPLYKKKLKVLRLFFFNFALI